MLWLLTVLSQLAYVQSQGARRTGNLVKLSFFGVGGNSNDNYPNISSAPKSAHFDPKRVKEITVGVAAVEEPEHENIGFSICGGAIPMSIEYLRNQGYLQNVDFKFYYNFTGCDPSLAVSVGMDFIKNKNVDVIIGPPCPDSLRMMGMLAGYYKTFIMTWGYATDPRFEDSERYPTMASIMPNALSIGYVAAKVMEKFKWNRITIMYTQSSVEYCETIINSLEMAIEDTHAYSPSIAQKSEIPSNPRQYNTLLQNAKQRSRIFLLCFNLGEEAREFMYRANENGMATDEYVFLILSMKSNGFGQTGKGSTTLSASGLTPFWEDLEFNNADGKNELAKAAAKRALVIDLDGLVEDKVWLKKFTAEVVPRVKGDPFFCSTFACLNNTGHVPGGFSRHLHDAFYLYGRSIDTIMKETPMNDIRNPDRLLEHVQISFNGLTGYVVINSNTSRDSVYMLFGLDNNYDELAYFNLSFVNSVAHIATGPSGGDSAIWSTRGGKIPLARPICGYLGTECPKTFWERNLIYVIIGAVLLAFMVTVVTFIIFFAIRSRRLLKARLNSEWQIPLSHLIDPSNHTTSQKSLQSTVVSEMSRTSQIMTFKFYELIILDKEKVLVTDHKPTQLTDKDEDWFIKLRKIDHLNLNNFIGMSLEGFHFKAIWKYCSRGSLQDIIDRGHMHLADSFFVFCVLRDISEALVFLHNSFIHVHGRLHSGCCLVNDGWQVKVADFGLQFLDIGTKTEDKTLLWKAPEHLRETGESQAGDIYSFAIIASEVINRQPAFSIKGRRESTDDLVYEIMKGGMKPIRPQFDAEDLDLSPTMFALVRGCWSEEPNDRPTAINIKIELHSIAPHEHKTLMDHVFNKMEEYTTTLEEEIEDRTKEVVIKKKKADLLLSKMLPTQVAEKLKLGQIVEPEGFDTVTVMFMDIVKFTELSAKCSSFQVVSLLNELYSNFDSIIEQHGVYKVESIGDGYLCVSGLPLRNGFRHIKDIVDMCLVIREYVRNYRISHLPAERVKLRFGINSGPCVAGVVGLSMPRYCLFGDTVNTASRMESNGKADQIHMSSLAHNLLVDHFHGQYTTESRGEVIIKGKGIMETFWLISRCDTFNLNSNNRYSPSSSKDQRNVHDEEPLYRQYSRQTTVVAEDLE